MRFQINMSEVCQIEGKRSERNIECDIEDDDLSPDDCVDATLRVLGAISHRSILADVKPDASLGGDAA